MKTKKVLLLFVLWIGIGLVLGAQPLKAQNVPKTDPNESIKTNEIEPSAAEVAGYQKAADQGFDEAQAAVGGMYEKGLGVPQDNEKAIEWYKKAAAQGEPSAQTALKRLNISGY